MAYEHGNLNVYSYVSSVACLLQTYTIMILLHVSIVKIRLIKEPFS